MAVIGTSNILQHHSLSIRITAGGFSFIITETATGDVWRKADFAVGESESMVEAMETAIANVGDQTFDNVQVVVNTPSTRIPLEEFRHDELITLYRVVFPTFDLNGMDICYTILPHLEIAEIFTIQQDVRALVSRHYALVSFENVCGIELERMMEHSRRSQLGVHALYAHFTDDMLLLCSIEEGRLVFANTFNTPRQADALYFTLYTWKTLGYDSLKDHFYISGDEIPTELLRNEVKKYIRTCNRLAES